jgi:primosomal protein N' (replication factor Y)
LGYNTLIECEQCSHTFVCPLCSTGLIYNKKTNTCSCNYCNYSSYINKCPICKSSKVKKSGYGIEKVVEFLNKIYNQEILIIDSRSVKKKSYLKYVLSQLAKDESMIIVGTNTVINGLDIGNLDLVVTTSIDNQLFYSNFKARENLFQVLTQLAGRTGRVSGNGHMIIQTGSKNNSVLNSVVSHDYVSFYKNEMRIRKQTKMPPFYNLCQLITYAKDLNYLKLITKSISEIFLLKNYDVILKEPFHNKLRDEYYLLLNIKYKNEDIKKDCTNIIKLLKEKRINYKIDYKIAIDIS